MNEAPDGSVECATGDAGDVGDVGDGDRRCSGTGADPHCRGQADGLRANSGLLEEPVGQRGTAQLTKRLVE